MALRRFALSGPIARLVLAILLIGSLHAGAIGEEDPNAKVENWNLQIAAIEKVLEKPPALDQRLSELRVRLETIIAEASAHVAKLTPRLGEVKTQIEKLGPAPKAGAPPEPDTVAAERRQLSELRSKLDGAIKTSGLVRVRAEQLIGKIEQIRRTAFATGLLKRRTSPLLPQVWHKMASDIGEVADRFGVLVGRWWARTAPHYRHLLGLGFGVLIGLLLQMFSHALVRYYRIGPEAGEPRFFRRASSTAWVSIARAMPIVGAALATYIALDQSGALTPDISRIFEAGLTALATYAMVTALAISVLAPNRPQWRLLPLADRSAPRLYRYMQAIAAVYSLEFFAKNLNELLFAPLPLTIAQSFIASVLFAVLLIALVRTVWGPADDVSPGSRWWPLWIKLPLWVVAVTIICAAILGYVALARFLASQVVVTGSILVAVTLLHLAIRELSLELREVGAPTGRWLSRRFAMDEPQRQRLALLVSTFLHVALFVAATPLLLLQWGFSWQEIASWLATLMFGFQVGTVRLSIVAILGAVAILVGGMIATRLFQYWLERSVLATAGIERGLANSIRTGVGYAGIALAALLSVSYLGLNFTNFAIIAGALSVGIGFGLQSIFNNFVSGLILLVERPIKVGDWIVVGNDQGYVRRISVRATEIETFDRASILIPNSELITNRVTNWTHQNTLGRAIIKVGVSYSADPKRVQELLLEIAEANDSILTSPAPSVVFEDFGASSLDFSLRFYLADINAVLSVSTALRMAILDRFRREGIEIPFPQQDVHLRDLDMAKAALARAIEARQRSEANSDSREKS